MHVAARRVAAGPVEIVDGVAGVAGALVVVGDEAEMLARPIAAAHYQPLGRLPVLIAPGALEHAVVGDLVQHVVLEDELARALEGARLAAVRELALQQTVERCRLDRRNAMQGLVPEHVADDAGLLQRPLLRRWQAVDARLKHAGQRRRHVHLEQLVGDDVPFVATGDDDAVVDQHAHQLLDEIRVAFGTAREQVAQCRRHRRQPKQQRVDQLAAAAPGQRRQVDALVVRLAAAPKRPPFVERRPGGAHQQQRQPGTALGDVVDEVERAFVGPVQIVEQEHDRHGSGTVQGTDILAQRMKRPVAQLLCLAGDAGDVRVGAVVEADELADQGDMLGGAFSQHGAQAARQLGLGDALRIAVQDLELRRQQIAQQTVRQVVAVRLRPATKQAMRQVAALQPVREFGQQPALAHASIGDHGDQHEHAVFSHRIEVLVQARQFRVAADHAHFQTLEAAVRHPEGARTRAEHDVAPDRLGDALDLNWRLRLHFEHAAHMAVGVVADAHPADRRRLFHPRRDVDRDAAYRAVAVDAAAKQHLPGVDAHAQLEVGEAVAVAKALGQGRRRGDERQAGADRALRVVFVRPVGAEHREQAVARVLEDAAVLRFHERGQVFERTVEHAVQILGIEVLAQTGGADHVGEKHRRGFQPLFFALALPALVGELVAQRPQRDVGDGVAEQRALRFERRDGGFDLRGTVFHGGRLDFSAVRGPAHRDSTMDAGGSLPRRLVELPPVFHPPFAGERYRLEVAAFIFAALSSTAPEAEENRCARNIFRSSVSLPSPRRHSRSPST